MKLVGCATLLAALVHATPGVGQHPIKAPPQQDPMSTPPTGSSQQPGEIVVVGRTPDAVDRSVEQLTQARSGRQVARWNGTVCLRSPGLDKAHEDYVFQRLTAAAQPLNITLRGGQCHADIMVVFTHDPDRVASFVIRRFPRLFQDTSQGITFLEKLRADLRSPAPVRWVNASRTGPAVGGDFQDGINNIYTASRLQESTRENAYHSLVLVDLDGMKGVTWAQLTDYLAMVTLANPAREARYGDDTIMSLFRARDEGRPIPPGLSPEDRSFLRALYTTSPAATTASTRAQIGAAIRHGR